ncbi:MAG: hypothetical protein AB7O52_11810 [Planctomycetota bacterium]
MATTDSNSIPADASGFRERDFALYRPELQRNEEYNDARLVVRRRLDAIGKAACAALSSKEVSLTSRASLHHPYTFNGYKVSSQCVYLSRGDKERKEIKRILGVELGKDLDQNFVHVLLVLEIYQHGLEVALRIHKDAWWDGENFKRRLKETVNREELARVLRALPEYGLRIDEHRKVHPCETMSPQELAEICQFYTPGQHWLHLSRDFDCEDPFVTDPGFLERVIAEFRRLLPVYILARWSADNNRLFG